MQGQEVAMRGPRRGEAGAVRSALRRSAAALGVLAVAVQATSAAALSGAPVSAGTPLESGPPSVAVDSSGTAYIAWADTKDLAGSHDTLQYCVIPVGTRACTHSGALIPAEGAEHIDGVQVLSDGATVVLLADVYGGPSAELGHFVPEQAWQSADGGATFTSVNAGRSVAHGNLDADTAPLGAVVLPGTGALGYGWNTAGNAGPTFHAFALSSPTECSAKSCSGESFAELEPSSNPDQISNAGGQFASNLGSGAGVLGVFNTDFSSGPLGCPGSGTAAFGLAFAYGSGAQAAANNYNVSPGSAGSAWRTPVTQAACDVEYPAVAGGPSGLGVLMENLGSGSTVYQRFDSATASFDTPQVTVSSSHELYPAISQDGAGGVYATYLLDGFGGPVALSYSPDGGSTWSGPVALGAAPEHRIEAATSSVSAAGQGWAAWTTNGSVYAQEFDAADAGKPTPAPTIGGTATAKGTTVTVTLECAPVPCTFTITITSGGATAARAHSALAKTVTLGTGRFTLRKRGRHAVTVHLTRAGRKLLAAHHYRLSVNMVVAEKIKGRTVVRARAVKIKPGR
jgi:hypothetical protein